MMRNDLVCNIWQCCFVSQHLLCKVVKEHFLAVHCCSYEVTVLILNGWQGPAKRTLYIRFLVAKLLQLL